MNGRIVANQWKYIGLDDTIDNPSILMANGATIEVSPIYSIIVLERNAAYIARIMKWSLESAHTGFGYKICCCRKECQVVMLAIFEESAMFAVPYNTE